MKSKKGKKVRSVHIEKVKDGKGGHLHKVVARFHEQPAQTGKGMKGLMPRFQEPEETYHKSAGAASKHMRKMVGQMTATPEEQPEGIGGDVDAGSAAAAESPMDSEDEE